MSRNTVEQQSIHPTYTSNLASNVMPNLSSNAASTLAAPENATRSLLLELTADIVSSYVANTTVDISNIPSLLRTVHDALTNLSNNSNSKSFHLTRLDPAVAIEDSVQPDYIVCLEDGKHLQVLKRHLKTAFGLSIEEYKKRWGLAADYPTVAPNYSLRRSSIAKDTGLGNTPKTKTRGPKASSYTAA